VQKQPDAFIVTVIKEPEKGTTLADVIVGSLAAVVAFVRVRWNLRHPAAYSRLPSVTPTIPEDPGAESSQAR
jgi:hypothetical protein